MQLPRPPQDFAASAPPLLLSSSASVCVETITPLRALPLPDFCGCLSRCSVHRRRDETADRGQRARPSSPPVISSPRWSIPSCYDHHFIELLLHSITRLVFQYRAGKAIPPGLHSLHLLGLSCCMDPPVWLMHRQSRSFPVGDVAPSGCRRRRRRRAPAPPRGACIAVLHRGVQVVRSCCFCSRGLPVAFACTSMAAMLRHRVAVRACDDVAICCGKSERLQHRRFRMSGLPLMNR